MHTKTWSFTWAALRGAMAVGITAAVIAQAIVTIGGAADRGSDVTTVTANFFSFFTILSNCLAAIVLAWAAVWLASAAARSSHVRTPAALAVAQACAATYMVVTGIVYNLLLRGIALEPGATVGWSNEVLHLIGPVFLALDVLIAPRPRRLPWATIAGILVFPLAWCAYTLLRGELITNPVTADPWWYPYPFIDPHGPAGWTGVWTYIAIIAVGIALIGVLIVATGRTRDRHRADR